MKKKASAGAVLAELLDELDAGRIPSEKLRARGRSALKAVQKNLKTAVAAAAASGKSGRPRVLSDERREEIGRADGTLAEVAARFGCSPNTVFIERKKRRPE